MRLKVYDFDDTLAVSSGFIKLHRGGEERRYFSHEFVGYSPAPGDLFCFTDLNTLTRVRLILPNWEELVEDSKCGRTDVMIVTSRPPGASSAIRRMFGSLGVSVRGVHAVGSGNPADKVSVIRDTLSRGPYSYVKFIDDNPKMVRAVESYLSECGVKEWDTVHYPHEHLKDTNLSGELGDFESDSYQVWTQTVK